MNTPNGPTQVKKQEDSDESPGKSSQKLDAKPPARILNRVPRACNACRKQKMRCEGAENPPCRRCRHAGLECLFEKPTREASLTGEAGLERIRSLEAHVSDIRQTQVAIQSTLTEIVSHLRNGLGPAHRSPSVYQPPPFTPDIQSQDSPATATASTPTNPPHPHPPQLMVDTHAPSSHGQHQQMVTPSQPSVISPPGSRPPLSAQQSSGAFHPIVGAPGHRPHAGQHQNAAGGHHHGPVLPPFSSIEGSGSSRSNVSSVRYQEEARQGGFRTQDSVGNKRPMPHSAVTSADSSDNEEEDNGELPASGLVAPWEVLRGLADVAVERASLENGDESQPVSRARTPDGDGRRSRPTKRRKVQHKPPRMVFQDVVTKGIITEHEARQLFQIFYHGCSTFLPIFEASVDTYESLRERSPFAVTVICMVAAKVRDGGGPPSEVYLKCLEEVQTISCATLFSPVARQEAVQAMILVSGWSDNGWLSGGHAVRMAMELSMHKAWPDLYKRMKAGKIGATSKDRELVVSTRTWLCLYLFEHQMSYGTGRPSILKDDESIYGCRLLLQHPLTIEDDMRLVSTVELMAIRERVNNNLQPIDRPVDDHTFNVLREADAEFASWYTTWDRAFSQKYENATFYRQSLQMQHIHAELYHNATALRGINGPTDVQQMPDAQRQLAIRSIHVARKCLDITLTAPAYKEGMKYAVHYTHATATFSASLLLRLARLFPDQCVIEEVRTQVEKLANLLFEIPGKRYAVTLQLMLKRSRKRTRVSQSRSPTLSREARHHRTASMDYASDHNGVGGTVPSDQQGQGGPASSQEPVTPAYEFSHQPMAAQMQMMHEPQGTVAFDSRVDNIWRGFETTSNEQLPVWLSDQTLGGNSFQQNGMDAFLLPHEFFPPAPQIW